MSFVLADLDMFGVAAEDLGRIGSAVEAGHLAALLPTTELAAAGGDEVSAAIAAVFGTHALRYQAAAAQVCHRRRCDGDDAASVYSRRKSGRIFALHARSPSRVGEPNAGAQSVPHCGEQAVPEGYQRGGEPLVLGDEAGGLAHRDHLGVAGLGVTGPTAQRRPVYDDDAPGPQ